MMIRNCSEEAILDVRGEQRESDDSGGESSYSCKAVKDHARGLEDRNQLNRADRDRAAFRTAIVQCNLSDRYKPRTRSCCFAAFREAAHKIRQLGIGGQRIDGMQH